MNFHSHPQLSLHALLGRFIRILWQAEKALEDLRKDGLPSLPLLLHKMSGTIYVIANTCEATQLSKSIKLPPSNSSVMYLRTITSRGLTTMNLPHI
jgi:hypothetical protein